MRRQAVQSKAHHFVPRFLLNNFQTPNGKVYVNDFKNATTRLQKSKKIAFATHLYTLDREGEDPEVVEKALANIESEAAPIIRALLNGRSLTSLSRDESLCIAVFVALQLSRVFKVRSYFESIKGHRTNLSVDADGASLIVKKGPDDPRRAHIALIHHSAYDLTKYLLNMTWVLIKPFGNENFHISDNPVTIYNSVEASKTVNLYEHLRTVYPPFSKTDNIKVHLENLLTQVGTEVYLPLSPGLALALVDPYVAALANLKSNSVHALKANQSDYVNLFQLVAAERYIYSVEELPKPWIPETPDEIWEVIVEGLTQILIDRNFIIQGLLENSKAIQELIESKGSLTELFTSMKVDEENSSFHD